MEHSYTISGRSCNGCKSHVEKTLNSVDGVIVAMVDLQKSEVIVEMISLIPLEAFQEALK